eukprot:CAMPEP_0184312394 /NCGR_PEP_ID=MMETSP1049-20130417/49840_1 /TAXON_ID=77928 /ORGANISM="Proteomonas sulcata, Strain CCMP704" /LENGTH=160 /DNA_ID=CAMNT_0026628531 /DNA_START=425 /DNA_END=907 /DNA_ORIENTATION=-
MTNRRSRFIVAASLAIGVGVAIVPQWVTNNLIKGGSDPTTKLINDSLEIVVSTPYCIGTLIAMFLHAIIPEDKELEEDECSLPVSSSDPSGDSLEAQKLQTVAVTVKSNALHTELSYVQEHRGSAVLSEISYAPEPEALPVQPDSQSQPCSLPGQAELAM